MPNWYDLEPEPQPRNAAEARAQLERLLIRVAAIELLAQIDREEAAEKGDSNGTTEENRDDARGEPEHAQARPATESGIAGAREPAPETARERRDRVRGNSRRADRPDRARGRAQARSVEPNAQVQQNRVPLERRRDRRGTRRG